MIQDEKDDLPNIRKHFPDFVWLLRDNRLTFEDSKTEATISPTEYIKNCILVRSDQSSEMLCLRDNVVRSMWENFPSIECQVLPPKPAKEFESEVGRVIDHLCQRIRMKNGYTDSDHTCTVDGLFLAGLLEKYVDGLKSTDSMFKINLETSWVDVAVAKLISLSHDLVTQYESEMNAKLPMDEDDLTAAHHAVLKSKQQILEKEIEMLLPVAAASRRKDLILDKFTKEIAQYEIGKNHPTGGVLYRLVRTNQDESEENCNQVFDEVYMPLIDNFDQAIKTRRNEYITKSIGPAKRRIWKRLSKRFDRIPPGEPQDLEAVGWGRNRIKLRWKQPDRHPMGVRYYIVEMKCGKDEEWSRVNETQRLRILVKGLESGTKYSFHVVSMNKGKLRGITSKEVTAETRHQTVTRFAMAGAAGVAAGVAAPISNLIGGAKAIHMARNEQLLGEFDNKSALVAGAVALGAAPLAIPLLPVVAPIVGLAVAQATFWHLESDGDLSDPDEETIDSKNLIARFISYEDTQL